MSRRTSRPDLVTYNQDNRDAWVACLARTLPAGTRILDVGAGMGRYRALFGHCDYQTQDFAQYQGTAGGLLSEAWRYDRLDYVSDAAALPMRDASFDAVLCTEVLEHVPEPIAVLREIARVLRPGGRAFISAPLGSGLHQQPYHFYGGFTPYFYRRFLDEFGMDVVAIEPNGRFFRLLLQELHRGATIVRRSDRYPVWHPARWLLRVATTQPVRQWLTRLDDEIPVEEFTAGYHVEAVKRPGL